MKQQLRKQALAARSQLTREERGQKSRLIKQKIQSLNSYQTAEIIMLYLDFRDEVETTSLVLEALQQGKRVIVPVCNPDRTLTPREIRNLTEDIVSGTWGIREARVECQEIDPAEIDLVLIPGVGFDERGNRLGYGAGYYDRFIPSLRNNVPLIALAFESQILPDLTPENHDYPMELVVTEARIIYCRKNI